MNHAMLIAGASLLAALIARGAWLSPSSLLLLSFVPALLILSRRRIDSPLIMLGYFGYNSLELPAILLNFFGGEHVALAYAAPIALALVLSAPFALINPSASYRVRALQAAAAFALVSLPPIGFIGWLNPLFASSALFPGLGLVGILLTLLAFSLLSALRKPARKSEALAVLVSLIALPFAAHALQGPRLAGPAWIGAMGASTGLGKPSEGLPYKREAWLMIDRAVEFHSGVSLDLLVLPESVIHDFNDLDYVALAPAMNAPDRPEVWLGVTKRTPEGRIENAIARLDGSIVAATRLPVPIGNWRPFMESGVVANPFGSDLVEGPGRKVAVSICYEDAVLWPHPGLLTGQSQALVSVSNHWALKGTRTSRAQAVAAHALARMADVPLIRSVNQ